MNGESGESFKIPGVDFGSVDDDFADLFALNEQHRLDSIKKAQAIEKKPVTTDDLESVFNDPEFRRRIEDLKNTPLTIRKVSTLDRLLAGIYNTDPEFPNTPEVAFLVAKPYANSQFEITENEIGKSGSAVVMAAEMNERPEMFPILHFHFEPTDPGYNKSIPLPSIVDEELGLSGDLAVLANLRTQHREYYGVDIKPIMVILQGGSGKGRLLIIQEVDTSHTYEQLINLRGQIDEIVHNFSYDHQAMFKCIRNAGYHFWAGEMSESVQFPDPETLKQFAFSPTNLN